jgi:hypothetical protein
VCREVVETDDNLKKMAILDTSTGGGMMLDMVLRAAAEPDETPTRTWKVSKAAVRRLAAKMDSPALPERRGYHAQGHFHCIVDPGSVHCAGTVRKYDWRLAALRGFDHDLHVASASLIASTR